MLPSFQIKVGKYYVDFINSLRVSHSLPLSLTLPISPPPSSFSVEEEEDEHDILTNHTHGRYTRSLGRFLHLFLSFPVCILGLSLSACFCHLSLNTSYVISTKNPPLILFFLLLLPYQ